jgi:hypothetical protein
MPQPSYALHGIALTEEEARASLGGSLTWRLRACARRFRVSIRCDALALQELSHQLQGRLLVSAVLDQSIENVPIGINGAP